MLALVFLSPKPSLDLAEGSGIPSQGIQDFLEIKESEFDPRLMVPWLSLLTGLLQALESRGMEQSKVGLLSPGFLGACMQ